MLQNKMRPKGRFYHPFADAQTVTSLAVSAYSSIWSKFM